MFSAELLMPMPIAIPPLQFTAIQNTFLSLKNVPPQWVPNEHHKALTDFLLLTPTVLTLGAVNRSVLVKYVEFARIVMSCNDFAPWVELSNVVSLWQTWAIQRRDGTANDAIDKTSLAVEIAYRSINKLLMARQDVIRREYTSPLKPELAAWHVHSSARGFSVFAILEENELTALRNTSTSPLEHLVTVPTKALLKGNWRVNNGYIIALGEKIKQLAKQSDCSGEWFEFDLT